MLVLMIEIIASTATFGYAILLIKYSKSRRTKGLPIPKKGQQPDLDNLKFHVRVLIPCYKESMELVKLTVLGALKAPLPKDTVRTVYLCDDGKDPTKEEMIRELNAEWGCLEYVSGRKRDPNGECVLAGGGSKRGSVSCSACAAGGLCAVNAATLGLAFPQAANTINVGVSMLVGRLSSLAEVAAAPQHSCNSCRAWCECEASAFACRSGLCETPLVLLAAALCPSYSYGLVTHLGYALCRPVCPGHLCCYHPLPPLQVRPTESPTTSTTASKM